MEDNVNRAIEETALHCKISMDLAGPKLRTGKMQDGPKVLRVKPQRDEFGRVTQAAQIWFSYPENAEHCPIDATFVPVQQEWIGLIEAGDILRMRDSRQKKRKLTVEKQIDNGILAYSSQTIYFMTGIPLQALRNDSLVAETRIGELDKLEQSIILRPGDLLIMHEEDIPGEDALYNEKGELIKEAHISCLIPELYDYVKPEEMVLLDDGKIEAKVESCQDRKLYLRILHAKPTGSRLKADKGINLPTSELHIRGLTEKDKGDLKFVAEHADIVNFSFVNESNDVKDLLAELKALQAPDKLGIILKIETRSGFENLPEILMSAMQSYPLGVMIARGDLAVECGWKHLAQVQEEILRICEAAHIPIVWATQVLENLAKTGLPSRAEITDAAMAQRAECVMLNKGPYILNAIRMLDEILRSMQDFQQKKAPMLPSLNIKSPLGK